MRKTITALLACALLSTLAPLSQAAPAPRARQDRLTYDGYLTDHLKVPAVKQAERFLLQQQKLGRRPAANPTADYGKPGCEPETTYEVGDERQFWVSQATAGNIQIDATLASKSKNGYLWVQSEFYLPVEGEAPEGGFVTQGEANLALEKWDKIYKINRKYFGPEPNPDQPAANLAPGLPKDWRDADCDPRVSILNFPIDTPANPSISYIAGYYSSEHEYPNGDGEHQSPYSNEMEMFFMNSAMLDVGDDTYAGVLAHEFYHMIQFSNDYNEETWVNEGMADIAAVVNGFGDIVQGHVDAYEDSPDQHLIDWGSSVEDYGQAFLFFDYLFNHYGEPDDTKTEDFESYLAMAQLLTKTTDDGLKGITKVLKARPKSVLRKLPPYFRKGNSAKVFRDYLVANAIDDPDAASGQFGYANRDVAVVSAGSDPQSAEDATAYPYGGEFYEFGGDQEGVIDMTVEDPIAVIPAKEGQPAPEGGYFAWSSRGDELVTWIQRGADLTSATAPTVNFKYWYLIEEDWDYAYVRVSEDQGNTWQFLTTTDCGGRATDPNGNNRAVVESGGITGDSGGWQECTLDLTQFAGKKILLRWEYDTDQAVTEPGYVIDDVQLTDGETPIWKMTNFERKKPAKKFKFGGDGLIKWRRIRPLAKNKPLVQLVKVGDKGVKRIVYRRRAFTKGEGLVLDRPATVSGNRTLLFITSTTPIATTPFGYRYQVN